MTSNAEYGIEGHSFPRGWFVIAEASELGAEPLVQARMLEVMAQAHQNLGRFEDAQGLEARVVELMAAATESSQTGKVRSRLPMRWARRACPSVLLILCAPVCSRSSRLR